MLAREVPEEAEVVAVRQRKSKRRKQSMGLVMGLDGFTAALIGLGAVSLMSLVLGLIFPAASVLPLALGGVLALVGAIWFLVVAFQDSAVAGLLCFFVPFYSLYYLATHFDDEKRPFFVQLLGIILLLAGPWRAELFS